MHKKTLSVGSLRYVDRIEEAMMRASMPRTSAKDPAPLDARPAAAPAAPLTFKLGSKMEVAS